MSEKIKIFLADDHKILRESLQSLLNQEMDFQVVGQADNGMEVIKLIEMIEIDVLLLDISMPKKNGLEIARDIKETHPNIKVVFLTMHKSEEMISEAFASGAKGYVLKENAFEELAEAIRKVNDGNVYVSSVLSSMLLNGFLENEKRTRELSDRELEILKMLAEGYSNKEISEMLVISIKTVETHRSNIMKKHNFKNITELVLYAVRNHIIEI